MQRWIFEFGLIYAVRSLTVGERSKRGRNQKEGIEEAGREEAQLT